MSAALTPVRRLSANRPKRVPADSVASDMTAMPKPPRSPLRPAPTRPPVVDAPESEARIRDRAAQNAAMNQGLAALSYLISGVVLYGLLVWLAQRYLHLPYGAGIGIVIGAGLGVYLIIKRFGGDAMATKAASSPAAESASPDRATSMVATDSSTAGAPRASQSVPTTNREERWDR